MRSLFALLSAVGLLLTIVPPFLVFYGKMGRGTYETLMLVGMIVWFAFAPFWMKARQPAESSH